MQLIKDKKLKPIIIVATLMLLAIVITMLIKSASGIDIVSANKFNTILQDGKKIDKIFIKDSYIVVKKGANAYKTALSGVDSKEILKKYPVEIYSKSSSYLVYIAVLLLLSILITVIAVLRKNSSSEQIPSKFKEPVNDMLNSNITPEYNSEISFKDIAGISDVKEDLEEIISFLKSPLKYKKLNIRMPKGVLLVGPPGVGKTLIAKAISSEANVPFFYHSGANFVHIYAGMGAKRVKELFNKAKEMSPSIIFIDEIDSVGKDRANLNSDEREATLNQLLVEMDGFGSNAGVIVIGATNRIDVLDSALLRPGRFDRRIFIDLPNLKEREQILKLYLKDKKHSLNIAEVAKTIAGFSPAAIETLINEAALHTIREGKESIDLSDIESVKTRVIFGKKRIPILSKKEREIESFYKASKAVTALWLGFSIDKVSLLISININSSDTIVSRESLLNIAKVNLSGLIYLKKRYSDIFNIAIEDKQKALSIIEEVASRYSIDSDTSRDSILNELILEVETMLETLDKPINNIANMLNSNESVSSAQIQKELDAIF